jgi:hypothetical protein
LVSFSVCPSLCESYNTNFSFSIAKFVGQIISSFENGRPLKSFTKNISETGSFVKLKNGRHFETKKDFELKIFTMIDPNMNNIQPKLYKI